MAAAAQPAAAVPPVGPAEPPRQKIPVGPATEPDTAAGIRVDLVETPNELIIVAELPGYTKDDIVLEGVNQHVRITADREDDYDDERLHLRERPLHVERIVPLPMPVTIDEANASFENGVCRIELPKIEKSQTHQIGFQ